MTSLARSGTALIVTALLVTGCTGTRHPAGDAAGRPTVARPVPDGGERAKVTHGWLTGTLVTRSRPAGPAIATAGSVVARSTSGVLLRTRAGPDGTFAWDAPVGVYQVWGTSTTRGSWLCRAPSPVVVSAARSVHATVTCEPDPAR